MTTTDKTTSVVELLNLQHKPITLFKHPPLILVVCQIRFTSVFAVSRRQFVAPFQRALQEVYPLAKQGGQVQLEIGLGKAQAPEVRTTNAKFWTFRDIEDNWTVSLGDDFLSIETRRYLDFADLAKRLGIILNLLVKHIKPQHVTRVGLRYINEFRPARTDWTNIIRPELLGLMGAANFAPYVNVAVHQTQMNFKDRQGLTMRYGLFPEGSTVQQQEGETPLTEPFYLLDLDMFKDSNPPNVLPMEPDTILAHIEDYNDAIYQVFRWAVTDDYIAALEVRDNGVD